MAPCPEAAGQDSVSSLLAEFALPGSHSRVRAITILLPLRGRAGRAPLRRAPERPSDTRYRAPRTIHKYNLIGDAIART